ncbi:MAG: DUF3303 family protein [Candidatus Thermoplasmatota archaeon]
MQFVTLFKILPGKYMEAIRILKKPKIPQGVKINTFLGTFGDYDGVVIFSADNEEAAAEFIIQFGDYVHPTTMLATPIEKLRWTR